MSELSSSNLFDCRSDESCIGRIFLVHLSLEANLAAGQCCGRVQHVRSEDAAHFATFAELSRFMHEHIDVAANRDVPGPEGRATSRLSGD
jgi:hypothetical protein